MAERLTKKFGAVKMPFIRLENGTIINRKNGKVVGREEGNNNYRVGILCSRNGTFYDKVSKDIYRKVNYNKL